MTKIGFNPDSNIYKIGVSQRSSFPAESSGIPQKGDSIEISGGGNESPFYSLKAGESDSKKEAGKAEKSGNAFHASFSSSSSLLGRIASKVMMGSLIGLVAFNTIASTPSFAADLNVSGTPGQASEMIMSSGASKIEDAKNQEIKNLIPGEVNCISGRFEPSIKIGNGLVNVKLDTGKIDYIGNIMQNPAFSKGLQLRGVNEGYTYKADITKNGNAINVKTLTENGNSDYTITKNADSTLVKGKIRGGSVDYAVTKNENGIFVHGKMNGSTVKYTITNEKEGMRLRGFVGGENQDYTVKNTDKGIHVRGWTGNGTIDYKIIEKDGVTEVKDILSGSSVKCTVSNNGDTVNVKGWDNGTVKYTVNRNGNETSINGTLQGHTVRLNVVGQ